MIYTKLMLTAATMVAVSGLGIASVWVPRGTEVDLRFEQSVSSNHAKPGDQVRMSVAHDVVINGHVVIRAGTPVEGIVSRAEKNGRYGKNGMLRIAVDPIRAMDGKHVSVQPRDKGQMFAGKRTNEAAAATVGGAVLLGPVGLVGGYFIAGKQVHIHPGDGMRTEVAHATRLS